MSCKVGVVLDLFQKGQASMEGASKFHWLLRSQHGKIRMKVPLEGGRGKEKKNVELKSFQE